MKIHYKFRSAFGAGESIEFHVSLPVGQDAEKFSPVIQVPDGRMFRLSSDEVNRLVNLIKEISVSVPFDCEDQRQTCDGWSSDLSIKFGFTEIMFHWFCSPPQRLQAVQNLVLEVENLGQTHSEGSREGLYWSVLKECKSPDGKIDHEKFLRLTGENPEDYS